MYHRTSQYAVKQGRVSKKKLQSFRDHFFKVITFSSSSSSFFGLLIYF